MCRPGGNAASGTLMSVDDFARAVSVERGRCARWVYDSFGRAANCPEPVIASGWLQVGQRWHHVDACAAHSGELRRRGPLATPAN